MHLRDVAIVAVVIICCTIVWSQESALNFRCGFKIPIQNNKTNSNIIPKPLLIVFRESGKRFFLTATSETHLGLFETTNSRFVSGRFVLPLRPIMKILFDFQIIAIATGFLEENASVPIVCVLTKNYELSAIDISSMHSRILWKTTVVPAGSWDFAHNVAISVVPERVYGDDVGMVTVAVKITNSDGAVFTRFAAFNGKNGEARWGFFSHGGGEMDDILHEANHTLPLKASEGDDIFNINLTKKKGHTNILHQIHHSPQRQGHPYEKPWTTFRETVIAALPHHYAHPWDVQLKPHTIYSAKHPKTIKAHRRGERSTSKLNNHIIHVNEEDYGVLGEKIALLKEKHTKGMHAAKTATAKDQHQPRSHRRLANTFVYHGKNDVVVLHMYTGNVITTLFPLKAYNSYYHDVDDDFHIESVTTQIGPRVSTYSNHGVDIVDDCLGIIYTSIPSAEDEIFNVTICDTQGFFGNLDLIHRFVDGDIRGEGVPRALNTLELLGSKNIVSKTTFSVMPLVVQVHQSKFLDLIQVERYAVFMLNSGLLTCVDLSRRRVLWRVQTSSSFSEVTNAHQAKMYLHDFEEDNRPKSFPHLVAYSLNQKSAEEDVSYVGGGGQQYTRADSYILAVGEDMLTSIHIKTGLISCSVALEEPPIAPVIVMDFNGDGINDLIVVSRGHIHGFIGSAQASSETLPVLMMLMIGLLVLLFISQRVFEPGDQPEYSLPSSTYPKVRDTKALKRATD
ncbi:unnamed protein product [Phytomonas sp. EM1]|nr:unnamed protein product [Phytomonas sp. EM1]|eukprot:CCW60352.1 unnamed protein product [Phytomonas sp. isolate EM1]